MIYIFGILFWIPQICGLCSPVPLIIGMGLQRVVMIIVTPVMLSQIWKVQARFKIMNSDIEATLSFSEGCADVTARLNPTYMEAAKQSVGKKVKDMYGFIWAVMAIFFFEIIVGTLILICACLSHGNISSNFYSLGEWCT